MFANANFPDLYKTLFNVNSTVVRAKSESELFDGICRIMVGVGGFAMAWVGLIDSNTKAISPASYFGDQISYLEDIKVSADAEDVFGGGPAGIAVRESRPYVCNNFKSDPHTGPWKAAADQAGLRSLIALPLKCDGSTVGCLIIYAKKTGFFDEERIALISQAAEDMSFALDKLRGEEKRRQAEHQQQTILDSIRDLVWLKDRNGKILVANRALCEFMGRSPDEIIGGVDDNFWPSKVARALAKQDKKVLKTKGSIRMEGSVPGKPDQYVETIKSPVFNPHGEIIGIAAVSRDISERRLLDIERQKSSDSLKRSLVETIEAISRIMELRDPYTAGHQRKVAALAVAIGRQLGLSEFQIEGLNIGGMIHDIGKIYVPAEILNRPGKLTAHELGVIQEHVRVGFEIVKSVSFPWPIAEMIHQHHERIDGSGYPKGLKGDDIILEAKIIAVADVFEAMSSHRPYRPALGPAPALQELHAYQGIRYDQEVLAACMAVLDGGWKFPGVE